MKNEFCTYEQALALKELGFDEPCLAFWDGKNTDAFYFNNIRDASGDYTPFQKHDRLKWFGAPLYQQAFRWFRENYNVQTLIKKNKSDHVWYIYEVYFERLATSENPPVMVGHTINSWLGLNLEFNTYEEAEQACLDKLIEIIKNK
jgi:hypothetical protein